MYESPNNPYESNQLNIPGLDGRYERDIFSRGHFDPESLPTVEVDELPEDDLSDLVACVTEEIEIALAK